MSCVLQNFQVPAILKTFYDEDILEEEILLEWGKKVSKKYISKELSEQIHKRAEPFMTWLKTAEEESEEDSDEDVQLEFDERAKTSTIKEKVSSSKRPGHIPLKVPNVEFDFVVCVQMSRNQRQRLG